MDITYLGHSCFKIKGKNASVVTDPYESSMVGLKLPSVSADIVTISHDHTDHNNYNAVAGEPKIISGAGEYEISGASIFGIPVFHDKKEGKERGRNTIYTIALDNIHLCHLGDLGHKLTEEQLETIGTIDILFVPVGGFYTIGPLEAYEIVSSIDPKVVAPMHYKAGNMENLSDLSVFIKEIGIEPVKVNKYTVVTPDKLPEERELIVFE